MTQSVLKWSQSEVCNLFSKLGRRDIEEVLRKIGYNGSSFLEIEWVVEEEGGVVGFSNSQLQYVLTIISYMTGRPL